MMDDTARLPMIRWLLETALDSEEEYLYQGEMSDYMRSYAADAIAELDDLFRASPPNPAEIACCVEALAEPGRIARGRSQQLLLWLRERSRPLLDALSRSDDPRLRIFALETGSTSLLGPRSYMPLYGTIDMKQRLLTDPDEAVRLAAIAVTKQTVEHNRDYLQRNLQRGSDIPMVGLFHQFLARLNDPSARVRAAAAKALGDWAAYAGYEVLAALLEHEEDPLAREALVRAKALCDPAPPDEKGR